MQRHPSRSYPGIAACLLLFAAGLLAPLVFRLLQMREQETGFAASDVRGILSDLALSLLFSGLVALLLSAPTRTWRWSLLALSSALWTALHYANYEHLRANGSMANLAHARYLADPTFLLGSALAISRPVTLLAVALGTLALAWSVRRAASDPPRLRVVAATALGVILIRTAWPSDGDGERWRQTHFLWENARRMLVSSAPVAKTASPVQPLPGYFPGDTKGDPRIALGHPGQNVLLIVLEALSGALLPSNARAQGARGPTHLDHLDRLARENLSYSGFVSLQRQTDRGMYSILCGDLPNLLPHESKMRGLAGRSGDGVLPCLPAALAEQGYATVYLQAAPLRFMDKDRFMKRAGFEEVLGHTWFDNALLRTRWGVDDRTFFEQVPAVVERLRSAGRPWLLTLLTVGTHHPYKVPDSFTGRYEPGTLEAAAEYLDLALAPFVERLQTSGVLDDTLVVITSDESLGFRSRLHNDTSTLLAQAWGLLVVLLPDRTTLRVDEPFSQMDLALSIMDYLGYGEDDGRFGGRSVFRRYPSPRPVVFGNTYRSGLGMLDEHGTLFVCDDRLAGCSSYQAEQGRLFAPDPSPIAADVPPPDALRAIAERSLIPSVGDTSSNVYRLVGPTVRLGDLMGDEVFGMQVWTLPAGTKLDVDLELVVRGGPGTEVNLQHSLQARSEILYSRTLERVPPDRKIVIRYSAGMASARRLVNCTLRAIQVAGEAGETHLEFLRATVTRGRLGDGEDPGIAEHEFSVR